MHILTEGLYLFSSIFKVRELHWKGVRKERPLGHRFNRIYLMSVNLNYPNSNDEYLSKHIAIILDVNICTESFPYKVGKYYLGVQKTRKVNYKNKELKWSTTFSVKVSNARVQLSSC